jgi:hypothetical protein
MSQDQVRTNAESTADDDCEVVKRPSLEAAGLRE